MPDKEMKGYTPIELIDFAADVEGLTGIEIMHPQHVGYDNLGED